jgi:hypothetical protein
VLDRKPRHRRRLTRSVLKQALYSVGLAAVGAVIGGLSVGGFPGAH